MTLSKSFSAVWCLTSFSWLLILLLSVCPVYWRWGTVNHELFPSCLHTLDHLGVCSFRKLILPIKQVGKHLFLYGHFQSYQWLARAREGHDDGTRGCKRTLAATTTPQAVGLPLPNPKKTMRMSTTYPSPFRCFENLTRSLQNMLQLILLEPYHHFYPQEERG